MAQDRFGYGTPYPEKNKDSVGLFQGKNERDHIELFGRFIQPTLEEAGIDSNSQLEIMGKFMQAPFEMKVSMLKELSNDTDDALWQSEAFLRIQERSSK